MTGAQDFTARTSSPLRRLSDEPSRMYMPIREIDDATARQMAEEAMYLARRVMPKLSGAAAKRLSPFYGPGFFGIAFPDTYVWFQEQGIQPFTMKNLAGKTIPMWINDPYGIERMKNPKAKTRTTDAGTLQVLIFRKAPQVGSSKMVQAQRSDSKKGIAKGQWIQKNRHFPGAPGRIANRKGTMTVGPLVTTFGSTGKIGKDNVSIWWRHPGLKPRLFLNYAITTTALMFGFEPTVIYADR